MDRDDVLTLVVLTVVPLALALAVLAISLNHRRRWVATASIVSGVTLVGSLTAYWWLWGIGFEHADSYRPVPAGIERAQAAAGLGAAVAYVLLIVAGAGSAVDVTLRRRPENRLR
ncbi:hypothetical protein GCM10009844_41650 [Nocardioides koreensis]|uniref:Uncharacterized protein n=1 Tax=Nocardioides koreensis TaxID=433651 RepID=A0ABN3A6K4_9ACTN